MYRPDRQPNQTLSKEERRNLDRRTTLADQEAKAKKAATDLRNRRLLIGGIIAGTTTVVLGGAFLASRRSVPGQPKSDNETASRLKDLDKKSTSNPNVLEDAAQEIAEMAVSDFHKETGRKAIDPKNVIEFYSDPKKFAARANSTSRCKTDTLDPRTAGLTDRYLEKIFMNLATSFTPVTTAQRVNPNPAAETYLNTKHELAHFTVESRPIDPEFSSLTGLSLDGFIALGLFVQKDGLEGCTLQVPQMRLIEEAVVHSEVLRTVTSLPGYENYISLGYKSLVDDFRSQIIMPYFMAFPNRLLQIQGESQPLEFFEEIGKRAKAKSPKANISNKEFGKIIIEPIVQKYQSQF